MQLWLSGHSVRKQLPNQHNTYWGRKPQRISCPALLCKLLQTLMPWAPCSLLSYSLSSGAGNAVEEACCSVQTASLSYHPLSPCHCTFVILISPVSPWNSSPLPLNPSLKYLSHAPSCSKSSELVQDFSKMSCCPRPPGLPHQNGSTQGGALGFGMCLIQALSMP